MSAPMSSRSFDGEAEGDDRAPPRVKRKGGRPKGAPNKKPRKAADGSIARNMTAAQLQQLVELARSKGLQRSPEREGDGDGEDGNNAPEDGGSSGRSTLELLADEAGISVGASAGRGGDSNSNRPTNDDPWHSAGLEGGELVDGDNDDDIDDIDDESFGDLDNDDVPFGAEIRTAEKRVRELRRKQRRQLKRQRLEHTLEDEIEREAAALDAALAAVYGPGGRPSDLLSTAKQRKSSGAEISSPMVDGRVQDEGQEEEDPQVQQRVPPVPYGRPEVGSSVDDDNSVEEKFEFNDLFRGVGIGDAGTQERGEDQLPDAIELIDRLDELLALDPPSESDARLPHPEAEPDEETVRLMQMSEDDQLLNPELRQVLVVIGKHLIRDQVTVEYASRIRRLVQGLKSGRLQPDLVCFTGGTVRDNRVADASAGYVFFRHLCEQHEVGTENIGILVESESTCTKEALDNVVKEVSRMEREELHEREREGEGRSAAWPRQKYHFTLISNEYHLSRIITVHQISETVSLLAPLKLLEASWGYEQVPYPYACSNDDAKEFQANVYKTLEDLVPLQVNVQAVANREEFFQEENYASLVHVRERLKEFIRRMNPSRERNERADNDKALREALVWAAGALAKIQEIIEPAAARRNSVSLRGWAMCAALLERAILQAQMSADPDRPLTPAEWGRLEDEKPPTPPLEVDEEDLIGRRARENVRAFLREDADQEPRREAYSYEAALKEEEEEEERERMRRERQGGPEEGMRWAGGDTRKDLSLQDNDDDDDDDDDSPPWSGRINPNANPEERLEEEGGREEEEEGGDLGDDGPLARTGSDFGSQVSPPPPLLGEETLQQREAARKGTSKPPGRSSSEDVDSKASAPAGAQREAGKRGGGGRVAANDGKARVARVVAKTLETTKEAPTPSSVPGSLPAAAAAAPTPPKRRRGRPRKTAVAPTQTE
ncbi:conserved unknown protein [Ectocarpus siliculosus]|uniref:DUF218 domain-containing protein n=1 Tax=Ectocarpus siliculosus TaxID=2880 RepID=D7FW21_ECTSI|nr:conserved unknown protein [Ectocarpus siliculosus]|eukprot:CBJ25541.1 conserved unknown protein [Ectocarpus siliculosus]